MKFLCDRLRLDVRTLALFRVGLGISLIWRLQSEHWSRTLAEGANPFWAYSPHALARGSLVEDLLIVLAAFVALCIVIGFRTRPALVANWLLLGSLYSAYPQFIQPVDSLIMAQSFLGIFLPLNARFAIDAALDRESRPTKTVLSVAGAVLLIFSILSLLAPSLRVLLADVPLREGDYPLVFATAIIPLIILLSPWQTTVRTTLVVLLICTVGMIAWRFDSSGSLYPYVVIAFCFVPTGCWEWSNRTPGARRRAALRIYFDGDCGFCLKTCLIFRTLLALGPVPISPAQETPAAHEIMQRHESWVVLDHDGAPFVRWHAVLLLLRRSPIFWPLGRILTAVGMGSWADGLYELIARNRGPLSQATARLLPIRPVTVQRGGIEGAIAATWLVLLLAVSTLNMVNTPSEIPGLPIVFANLFGLDQDWGKALYRL